MTIIAYADIITPGAGRPTHWRWLVGHDVMQEAGAKVVAIHCVLTPDRLFIIAIRGR
ncbi:hypothetical protein [Cupriavidus sp. CuC1]|uniref:hypothetical protein n=1 Tax=Cupriavidus sp. CuC1 TaxID=3373131 RepID=UPI0037D0DF61